LPGILTLSKHSCSHNLESVLARYKVRRLEEYSSAIVPWHGLPFGFGGKGAVDSSGYSSLISFVIRAKMICVVRWDDLLSKLPGFDLKNSLEPRDAPALR
jgi:hypothetical protein